jgi:hypothetical protein
MATCSLQLCKDLLVSPAVIVTNDWFSALCAAYARCWTDFRDYFSNTVFFHIVHNLEEGYQGVRVFLCDYYRNLTLRRMCVAEARAGFA